MDHHIALYLDEHVQITLAEGLRLRGVDVMTTQETGNHSLCDEDQLAFALKEGRALLSFNKRHFAKIHYEWMNKMKSHAGIILSDQLAVGVLIRRLMKLYVSLSR